MNMFSTRPLWQKLLTGAILLVVSLLVAYGVLTNSQSNTNPVSTAANIEQTPTSLATQVTPPTQAPQATRALLPTISRRDFNGTVTALVQTLPTTVVDPTFAAQQPDKADALRKSDIYYRAMATVEAQHDVELLPSATPVVLLTPWPTTTGWSERPMGSGTLIQSHYGILGPPCELIRAENYWHKNLAGYEINVCAGSKRGAGIDAPSPGMVMVRTLYTDRATPGTAQVYQVPDQAQSVAIVDVDSDGIVFTVQEGYGRRFYFNLATRQWVNP
jgi:hypothetical protein